MIRVCHMTSVHRQEDERIFHKECVSLAKAGYETYLVQRGESYEKEGVHIVGFGGVTGGRLKRMTQVAHQAYEVALSLDADIYHFHDPELLPYGPKLKKKGKRVIFDSHEDVVGTIQQREWIPAFLRQFVAWGYARLERAICRQLDAVISATPHVAKHFNSINPCSILVTNYPILSLNIQTPTFQSKTLIFAGGILPQWNHHVIIKALELLPDCEYLLYGWGDDSYLKELQSLPGWKQVRYFGHVSHKRVLNLLAEGYVGLSLLSYIPNSDGKNGTMSNTKIFEEMMAGLPVVCTDFVLWREFVERWHCGICIPPEDPETLAATIQYLIDHPEEARQMGENARKAVEKEFNWRSEEKKLLQLYEELAKMVGKQ